ncbi:MAG: aminotransferase class I/II-fold pyridoxal phosphate-dependent enzyme, partial [Marmoricola sp.]
ELLRAIDQVRPDLAYLVPDFHNPTGHLMPAEARAEVAARLRTVGAVAVVDESMVDLALDGEVPEPLGAHARDAITVGSVSKPFWGGLRVGWLRAPAEAMDAMVRSRLSLDLGVPVLEQLVAADLLRDPEALLSEKRAVLRAGRDAAVAALTTHLPDWKVRTPGGGLSLWCELPEARSTDLLPRAAEHGVLLAPGPSFAPEGGLDRFLRLPFTQPAHVLADAVARLVPAWEATLGTSPARSVAARSDGPTLVA